MSLILDHLTAILVGASLLGVLLFVQQRGQQKSTENLIRQQIQLQSFSIMETLERDLENMRNSEHTGESARVSRSGSNTSFLRFVTLEDPSLGAASGLIAVVYRLEDTYRQVYVNGSPTPVYRLARYVNDGSGTGVFTGGSTETFTSFDVSLISRDAQTVVTNGSEPMDFAMVRVEVEAALGQVSMLAHDQSNRSRSNQSRQAFTFRPFGLLIDADVAPAPVGTVPSLWPSLPESPYEPEPEPEPEPESEGPDGESGDGEPTPPSPSPSPSPPPAPPPPTPEPPPGYEI